MWLPALSFLRN